MPLQKKGHAMISLAENWTWEAQLDGDLEWFAM